MLDSEYPIFKSIVDLHVHVGLLIFFPFYIFSDDSVSSILPDAKSKSEVGKGKGDRGKSKARNENPPPVAPYSFTEAQEEEIAHWIENKKLLYDMKDKQYKDKALRRQLWEGKAAEYGVDCKFKIQTLQLL